MHALPPEVASALRKLTGDYRTRCLWFLEADYNPSTLDEALRVLAAIERHGDLAAFKRSSEIRQWLSQSFSAASVGS